MYITSSMTCVCDTESSLDSGIQTRTLVVPWCRDVEWAWLGPCELGAGGEGVFLGRILGVEDFAVVVQTVA